MLRSLLFGAATLFLAEAFACSCFGPQTFCETLNPQPPQFPEPEWWIPSDIIMAVKINGIEYGADMKVVQTFAGDLQAEQVIRVWGDCGLLCRHYVNGVDDGDTVIWALQHCDLSGNGSCGTSFEQAGDYQLSVCGIYWLNYGNGIISGPLFTAGANESVPLGEFASMVGGCLSTGVSPTQDRDPLSVRYADGTPILELNDGASAVADVDLYDPQGRLVFRRTWNGTPLRLEGPGHGVFIAQVMRHGQRWVRKVIIR